MTAVTEPRLKETVALVTGASRGGGKGIALVLGEEGATVYVTGRSRPRRADHAGPPRDDRRHRRRGDWPRRLGIAVRCDHAEDAQVDALFERIYDEQGRLDLPGRQRLEWI